MTGKLYIIATPIGNLKDITFRAVEILKEVDVIACEDTRVSRRLLDAYDITNRVISYHQHSKDAKVDNIISYLQDGKSVGVITDAGTPGISDPGNKLVSLVYQKLPDCQIIPIPGSSAVIAALSVSGLPTDRYVFFGFMPHKKGKQTMIKQILDNEYTCVFYESSHRIMKTLDMFKNMMPPGAKKQIVVARELTKKFETIYRGNIEQIINNLNQDTTKGEFVVVIK